MCMASQDWRGSNALKADAVLEYASHLERSLEDCDDSCSTRLGDVSLYLKAFPLPSAHLSSGTRRALNRKGVTLWNACSKLKRTSAYARDQSLGTIRAFAYFLLEAAQGSDPKISTNTTRLFKSAVKAAKDCLEFDLLDLASNILERAAAQEEVFVKHSSCDPSANVDTCARLSADYFILRLALSWRRDRLDLAEHFFVKLDPTQLRRCPPIAEKLVDLLLDIGNERLHQNQNEAAVRWLERAFKILQDQELHKLSSDAGELNLNVLHTYARSLLMLEDQGAGLKAHNILTILQENYGNKLAVVLLQIELLSRDVSPNVDAYFASQHPSAIERFLLNVPGLSTISRTVHLSDANHKMVMHYIHKLRGHSTQFAYKALRQFLLQRLAPHDNYQWVRCAILTLIWFSITEEEAATLLPDLHSTLNDLSAMWSRCLDAEATHGAFVLIWKKIEQTCKDNNIKETIGWCDLALRSIFQNGGDSAIGKIERKLAYSHLRERNLETAREVLQRMSSVRQSHRLSRYLQYCVAMRSRENAVAQEVLSSMKNSSSYDNQVLIACVSETLRYGSKEQGANILQSLLDSYLAHSIPDIDVAALLRCLARLLISLIDEATSTPEATIEQLCKIFQVASCLARQLNSCTGHGLQRFPTAECDWFSKNSFNLALKRCKDWPAKYITSLLDSCLNIQYPHSDALKPLSMDQDSTRLQRNILCYYLQAVIFTSAARTNRIHKQHASKSQSEADSSDAATDYTHLYDKVAACTTCFTEAVKNRNAGKLSAGAWQQDGKVSEESWLSIREKHITLLPLAFEARLFNRAGISSPGGRLCTLEYVLDTARDAKATAKTYALFADMVLSQVSSNDSTESLSIEDATTLLRKIIFSIRMLPGYNVEQASRWIRCVVQLVLDNTAVNDGDHGSKLNIVEVVVDQAIILAQQQKQQSTRDDEDTDMRNGEEAVGAAGSKLAYPVEELEWLSTTLFNRAVDYYVAEQEERAKQWAGKAVEVADVLAIDGQGDGGLLRRVLREKMETLGW